MIANNINKNTSVKIFQPEWEGGLKSSKKPTDFLTRALQPCERATVRSWNGHSCNATVAVLQARLSPFRAVFGPRYVLNKFKRLIISTLKMSQKSLICDEQVACCKYRKQRGWKRINSLTIIYPKVSPLNIGWGGEIIGQMIGGKNCRQKSARMGLLKPWQAMGSCRPFCS